MGSWGTFSVVTTRSARGLISHALKTFVVAAVAVVVVTVTDFKCSLRNAGVAGLFKFIGHVVTVVVSVVAAEFKISSAAVHITLRVLQRTECVHPPKSI